MKEANIELGNSTEERIRLEAERANETIEDFIVSFFEERCNVPSSLSDEVQCTSADGQPCKASQPLSKRT